MQKIKAKAEVIFRALLNLEFRDFEDAVQASAGEIVGVDFLITRNEKDFRNSPIPVLSPVDFLSRM